MGTRLMAAAAALFLAACSSSSDAEDDVRRECDALGAPGSAVTLGQADSRLAGLFSTQVDCPPFGDQERPALLPFQDRPDSCPYTNPATPVCTLSYTDLGVTSGGCGLSCFRCEVRVIGPAGSPDGDLPAESQVCATRFFSGN